MGKLQKYNDAAAVEEALDKGKAAHEALGGHTVKSDVPEGAKFTDTVYDDTAVKANILANTEAINQNKTDILKVDEKIEEIEDKITALSQIEPPKIVSSVEEMTDTTKHYVLDGYIWQYGKVKGSLVPNFTNQFDKSRVHVNKRYASNALVSYDEYTGSSSETQFTGHFVVHNIPIDFSDLTKEHVIRVGNFAQSIKQGSNAVCPLRDDTLTPITDYAISLALVGEKFFTVNSDDLNLQTITMPITSYWYTKAQLQSRIVSFGLVLKLSDSTITLDDVPDNLIITVDEPIEYTQGADRYEWINTGHAYVPTDYESRITELEEKNSEMQNDIDSMKSVYLNIDLLKNDNIKSVNHRGFNTIAPENTLSAYKLSKQKGYEYVECDVSLTSDKIPVLLHDSTVDRTSNGTGNINDMTFEQVRALDFGSWKSAAYAGEQIPTFEEFIALCRKLGLKPYIELKSGFSETDVQSVYNIVKRYNMQKNSTWISFSKEALQYVVNCDNSARIGVVTSAFDSNYIPLIEDLKTETNEVFADILYTNLTEEIVQICINNSIPLEVWTCNSISAMTALDGYVSGITSDIEPAGKLLVDSVLK